MARTRRNATLYSTLGTAPSRGHSDRPGAVRYVAYRTLSIAGVICDRRGSGWAMHALWGGARTSSSTRGPHDATAGSLEKLAGQ